MRRLVFVAGTFALCALAGMGLAEILCRFGLLSGPLAELRRAQSRPHSSFRALILGDSYLQKAGGLGHLLTERLEARGGAVADLAQPGSRPVDYLRALSAYGMSFKPEVVVLGVTAANDVTDTALRTDVLELEAALEGARRPRCCAVAAFTTWSLRRRESRLKDVYGRWQLRSEPERTDRAANPFLSAVARLHPDFVAMNVALEGTTAKRAWEFDERLLAKAQDLAQAGGAKLLVVLFPHPAQVNAASHPFFRAAGFDVDPTWVRRAVLQERFAAFCARRKLACLDPLTDLRALREPLYREHDDHFNERGEGAVSELILRELDRRGFVRPL